MNEDDIYRSSTQFRHWSFTRESLDNLRESTNSLAAARVKDAIQRRRAEGGDPETQGEGEVDCLTVEEEQRLVSYYCMQAMEFADFCGFPTAVKATAVQYLKRFYLSNSPMTYHPKQIMPAAQFLATKTENFYTRLKDFAEKLPRTTAEEVIAPEFLLTQGLRFTFDVRHPFRGLEGGAMELHALADGALLPPAAAATDASSQSLQERMLALVPAAQSGAPRSSTVADAHQRVEAAHKHASQLLKTSALLTDAYLLFTPAQIWLAALLAADEPLTRFYLETVLGADGAGSTTAEALEVVRACAGMLASAPATGKPSDEERRELKRIDKKLFKCRNPEKVDLVGINQAQKRDGEAKGGEPGEPGVDEKVIKKRKLEREAAQKEGDDLFGPSIQR